MCYVYMQLTPSQIRLKSTAVKIMNIIQHMFIAQCCYGVEIKFLQLNMTRGDIKIQSRLLRLTLLYLLIFPKPVKYKTRRYLFPNFPSNQKEKFKWVSLVYPQNFWPDLQEFRHHSLVKRWHWLLQKAGHIITSRHL